MSDGSSKSGIPTSYAFELLTIRRWEEGGRLKQFSVKGAFIDIMTQLENFHNIDAHWTRYYDRQRDFGHASVKECGK